MKTYIAPALEIVEVDALNTMLFVTSPVNAQPTTDDPANQFSKNRFIDFTDDMFVEDEEE